jgi:hypothetical protein
MQQLFFKINIKFPFLALCWVLFVIDSTVLAGESSIPTKINWVKHTAYTFQGQTYPTFYTFSTAQFNAGISGVVPIITEQIAIGGIEGITVSIRNPTYEELGISEEFQDKKYLTSNCSPTFTVGYSQQKPYALVSLVPARINSGGKVELLKSFEWVVQFSGTYRAQAPFLKKAYAANSVLAHGQWYKIGVTQTGVHAITKQFLRDAGVDVDGIDPRTIKIYGKGAGMLPQKSSVFRFDDLPENAIMVEGESDGVWDENERVLFYGKAQKDLWTYDGVSGRYAHQTNIYSDITYYFITFGGSVGKRITTAASAGVPNVSVNQYDKLYFHEQERVNLIRSGRIWLGEEFSRVNSYPFTVDMGTVNTAEPLYVASSVVARSFAASSFTVKINNTALMNHSVPAVIANFEYPYASSDGQKSSTINIGSGRVDISYSYAASVAGSTGWLNYFELQTRNWLTQETAQLNFRDARSIAPANIAEYTITSGNPVTVWDVTVPTDVHRYAVTASGGSYKFSCPADTLHEFTSFDGSMFISPVSITKIGNQNLHALSPADLFIITHPQFIDEAKNLASFHQQYSGLRVHVITTSQIYNEFSSGMQDVVAIRDFMRMFYKRAVTPQDYPKYLTLFGRASYDYKDRVTNNTNYVPTYESLESFDPVSSYNSDDFFGLLDDTEGNWDSNTDVKELLDIAIGRLPAQDHTQANDMVAKIIAYASNPTFGDWKTKLVFVADDEDGNIHLNQADALANNAINNFKDYNVKKIFIDAYKEENTSGGERNPLAQQEIVNSVQQGAMIINYTGHGGEIGWASERILNTDDIQQWTNGGKLPLFVTATCEFSRFDDPARTSAGEMVLLNPNGGGIALFTTVRLVNSGSNAALNGFFYNNIGLDSASAFDRKHLGEVLRLTKNNYIFNDKNERNFTLLGDPAIFLAYPTHRIVTTSINTNPVGSTPDTLKAFAKVVITGRVLDIHNNPVSNFNGVVYPTVYDKASTYTTIANNTTSFAAPFVMQNNVIYRGKASVVNGLFSFSFVVPKDISYNIGYGKVSYEGDNGKVDGIGYYQNIIVGGTADSIPQDNAGPEMNLFLNDEKFVYGGITDPNPTLIVKLKDEYGINIIGRGVGRDISMVLNNDATKTTSLNEYYQAKIDSYQEGEVRYPIKDLPQGKNMLTVRAFDIYNNPSDAMLEFVVATSEEMALQHVLNYPNPFTTNTTFHFDHNKAGEPITVQVQIFTISGKLIKTLQADAVSNGNHFDQLSWDGKDDFGDHIGKGAYIYKVKVKSTTGKSAEQLQKLVILN